MSNESNSTDVTSHGIIRQVYVLAQDLRAEDFSIGKGPIIALAIAAWFLLSAYTRPTLEIAGAPVSGRLSAWEPNFSLFWRYTANAREIIGGGVEKVGQFTLFMCCSLANNF